MQMNLDHEIDAAIAKGDFRFIPDPLSMTTCCTRSLFLSHLARFLKTLQMGPDESREIDRIVQWLAAADSEPASSKDSGGDSHNGRLPEILSVVIDMLRGAGEFFENSGDTYQVRQFAWRIAGCKLFLNGSD